MEFTWFRDKLLINQGTVLGHLLGVHRRDPSVRHDRGDSPAVHFADVAGVESAGFGASGRRGGPRVAREQPRWLRDLGWATGQLELAVELKVLHPYLTFLFFELCQTPSIL